MSTTTEKTRIRFSEAKAIADSAIDRLAPYCERIEVGGSIRRQLMSIGDVEIVCVPKFGTAFVRDPNDLLFGGCERENVNLLRNALDDLVGDGTMQPRLGKDGKAARGDRYQRLVFQDFALDVFSVLEPAQWGCVATLRTGPHQFNRWIVCPAPTGALPTSTIMDAGSLWYGTRDYSKKDNPITYKGSQILTPTEESFFDALGIPWIPPTERDKFIERLIATNQWTEK